MTMRMWIATAAAACLIWAVSSAFAAPACQSIKDARTCDIQGCVWVAAKKGKAKCQPMKVNPMPKPRPIG